VSPAKIQGRGCGVSAAIPHAGPPSGMAMFIAKPEKRKPQTQTLRLQLLKKHLPKIFLKNYCLKEFRKQKSPGKGVVIFYFGKSFFRGSVVKTGCPDIRTLSCRKVV
jgi:hypothetical protein